MKISITFYLKRKFFSFRFHEQNVLGKPNQTKPNQHIKNKKKKFIMNESDTYKKLSSTQIAFSSSLSSTFFIDKGVVYSCGKNEGFQLGNTTNKSVHTPTDIKLSSSNPYVKAIAAGYQHTLFLTGMKYYILLNFFILYL